MIILFEIWGIPKKLRADNGKPFGEPQRDAVPLITLWLVGIGIQPEWIRPNRPTDNAVVERAQQTTSKWLDLKKIRNTQELENGLKIICERQTKKYKVKRLNHLTRIQAFPCLEQKQRLYHVELFELEQVLKFLATRTFSRKVSKAGQVSIFGRKHSIGVKYTYQYVYLKLNLTTNQWEVKDKNNKFIRTFRTHYLTKTNIIQFNLVKELK